MSIVFGLFTSDPNLLGCQLRRLHDQVRLSEDGGPHNAVGVGSYADDTVLLHRYPSTGMPRLVTELPTTGQSSALLYHGRSLPVGTSLEDNTQPFRFRRWLFAQVGELEGYRGFKQQAWEELPDHLKRQVRGETDAELAFALFLNGLREVGRTDDRTLDPLQALRILGAAARHLQDLSSRHSPHKAVNLGWVATNESLLIACRLGQASLSVRLLEGQGSCAVHKLVKGSPQSEPLLRAHERCRSVAVASHAIAEGGWTPLEDGMGIAVGNRGNLERAGI